MLRGLVRSDDDDVPVDYIFTGIKATANQRNAGAAMYGLTKRRQKVDALPDVCCAAPHASISTYVAV